jgi:lysophospholipase L1-like esterase
VDAPTVRFLALGDSYTIGERVSADQRWPVQLAASLRERELMIADPEIVARTGWTTDELMEAIAGAELDGTYDLVTLQIGVNNQYRGYSLDSYRDDFRSLLKTAIEFTGGEPANVVVLSIPDWGVTPFAAGRDRDQIADEIESFNAVNHQETEAVGAEYLDVTTISRGASDDPSLIAEDGLHPSGKMYAAWVQALTPQVFALLVGDAP